MTMSPDRRCLITPADIKVEPSIVGKGLTAQQISCPRGVECALLSAIYRPHMEYPGAVSKEKVLQQAVQSIREYCERRQRDNERLASPWN